MVFGLFKPSEQKKKEKTAFQAAFEAEKELVKEERATAKKKREKVKLERAAERGAARARNPLFKRVAKKVGATTAEGIKAVSTQIGAELRRGQERGSKLKQLKKIGRDKEIEKLTLQAGRLEGKQQFEKKQSGGFFGVAGPGISGAPVKEEQGPDILGTRGSGTKGPLGDLGTGDFFGTGKKKKAGMKKNNFLL